jgi:hypothetical protein
VSLSPATVLVAVGSGSQIMRYAWQVIFNLSPLLPPCPDFHGGVGVVKHGHGLQAFRQRAEFGWVARVTCVAAISDRGAKRDDLALTSRPVARVVRPGAFRFLLRRGRRGRRNFTALSSASSAAARVLELKRLDSGLRRNDPVLYSPPCRRRCEEGTQLDLTPR